MKTVLTAITMCSIFASGSTCHAASTPDGLAHALQTAFAKGDFDAARKLADIDDAPAELHFYFLDTVRECASEATCTVSAAATNEELRQQLKEQAEQLQAQAPDVDGMITVAVKSKDGSGSGTMQMPYAKFGNEYKVTSIHYSPAEFAALRAKTDEILVEEFFAMGIRDVGATEARTDWATAATRLPADGGDAGKAFVAQTRAMSTAVDAKDPDAAMRSGGQTAQIVHRDKDFDGKPIPMLDRQRKLQVQSLRMLRDVKVNGGYMLGDNAVLLIEARNGIGWIVRGPVLLTRDGDAWERAGDHTVSYPAES